MVMSFSNIRLQAWATFTSSKKLLNVLLVFDLKYRQKALALRLATEAISVSVIFL